MRNRYKYMTMISCMMADIIALLVSFHLFHYTVNDDHYNVINLQQTTVITWVLAAIVFRLYHFKEDLHVIAFFRRSWSVFVTQTLLTYIILWRLPIEISQISGLWLFTGMLLYLLISRIIIASLLIRIQSKSQKIGIWGFNLAGIRLAAYFEAINQPVQFFDENESEPHDYPDRIRTSLVNTINIAAKAKLKELYVVMHQDYLEDMGLYIKLADSHCLRVRFIPFYPDMSVDQFTVSTLAGFQVICSRPEPLAESINRLKKRTFDVLFSLFVILFVLSWLYPLLACIIKWESRGPVLFKQLRTGENNKAFWCYKFRSMKVNTESDTRQAQKKDDRLTHIGRFIRKTSLDELPQFYNVLIGEMSVVGPRPHMLKHTCDYSQVVENYMVRHFIKPGITGLSQIKGLRGETKQIVEMQNRIDSDIEYLTYWSFMKDLKICLLTIYTALKGDEKAF
ncbi:exopolysaccharide biosynthesis polyprenyl glycosylphosphotransferase [Pedobacter sp. KLB.chiD]|uniref:exopolysaccharide biosynthesis polyprenyl glycosylphosphotransferase n=1 Tax=Pedobacter sp. KLB.chiD TaxID=3387402 RepID=UPI00399C2911